MSEPIRTSVGAREPVRYFWWVLWIGVILSGCLYVGQRWSPSSYAIVLQQFGVVDTGVVAGLPRVERGDEFAWQTPLLQMTIRSGFQRFDRTPPYFEDLRSLYGMPIRDWAVVFKPQFWLFFVAPPALALSFYHFLLIALFVVGFTLVFIRFGGREWHSLFMALTLFFYVRTCSTGGTGRRTSSSRSSPGSCWRCSGTSRSRSGCCFSTGGSSAGC